MSLISLDLTFPLVFEIPYLLPNCAVPNIIRSVVYFNTQDNF